MLRPFLALLFPLTLAAQQPLRFSPVFRNYTTEQGLPNNWVYGIRQDRQGYIWISTDKGVCRFDGYAFRQFPDTLYTNHTAVFGTSIAEDEAGRMWLLDAQNRIFYIENDRIVPWKHNRLLDSLRDRLNDLSWLIVKGRGEEVLVGAQQTGILRVTDAGAWAFLPRPENAGWHVYEYRGQMIMCPVISSEFTALIFPFSGFSAPLFFQNETGSVLSEKPFCPGSIGKNRSYLGRLPGGSWMYFYLGYVYCFQSGKLQWFREYGDKAVERVAQGPDGALYVGSVRGGGLEVYRSLEDFRRDRVARRLLQGLSVAYIYFDREGGCWIATQEQGVFYCAAIDFGRPEQPGALREGVIKSLDWDRRRTLYAGTVAGEVFALDLSGGGAWDISPPGMTYLDNLYFDTTSQTLTASGGGQQGRFFSRGTWSDQTYYDHILKRLSSAQGPFIFPGHSPGVWLDISYGGLREVDISSKTILRSTYWSQKKHTRYYAIRCDQSGRVWASGRQGLVEWVGDSILPAHQGHEALRQRINDIELLPDTTLVLCPRGRGVVVWKPGRAPLEINTEQGLLSAGINALHCSPGGVIWACSDRGLNKLTPDGRGGYRVTSYTMKQGLPSNTVYDALSIGDTVWVATHRGLFRMIERSDTTRMPAPLLASVSVHNALYFPGKLLDLPHDSADVALEFVALHFRSQGQIQYAFRLSPSGANTPWTNTADRRVNFPNLNPGVYRFEVKAQIESGAWSAVAALDIRIRPPWYATWWARGLFALALGLAVFGIYRYRTNQIRTESRLREEMLRLERSALQAQMNPHFIFNCLNSIQDFIQRNERDSAVLYLAKFAKLVRGALNASVAGTVRLEDEIQMLDNYLALERLRFRQAFDYSIDVDEALDTGDVLLPPLIVQPFVENAVLHGMRGKDKDGYIGVRFRQANDYLYIEVQDNGAGWEQRNASGEKPSLGRSITQRRLDLLNRQSEQEAISVHYHVPDNGVGTLVSIRLPL